MNVLTSELHLHLYGCLTPEQIFELGKDLCHRRVDALNWYRSEYKRLTGTDVDPFTYWSGSAAIENISRDFLATTPMSFLEFQARFNLMIALLPTVEFAPLVMRHVVADQVRQKIDYCEYRIFVPPVLSAADLSLYYQRLATEAQSLNQRYSGQHTVRIILSMSRNPVTFLTQYQALKQLQIRDSVVTAMITGIDFCGVEEGFPPELLQAVCATIRKDNTTCPQQSLAILYHVGESFDQMSIFSAMRWILAADDMGAYRLGHAIAVGINIADCTRFSDGSIFSDPDDQVNAMIEFLRASPLFNEERPTRDFLLKLYEARASENRDFIWNHDLRNAATTLQTLVLARLTSRKTIIETCPTSNRIIGRIADVKDLPVFRFAREHIRMVISSDDPGIFGVKLASEEQLVSGPEGLMQAELALVAENNLTLRAGILAGRTTY